MTRRVLTGKRILLTGASSGIGRALAEQLAAEGSQLIITARRIDRLKQVAEACRAASLPSRGTTIPTGAIVEIVGGDITERATRERLSQAVQSHWGGLDILINNAGVGAVGPFDTASSDRLQRIMDVNFMAPVQLVRSMLPWLRLGEAPLIVNMGSVLGHVSVPMKSEYCASKAALRSFSDSLRIELAKESIDVLWVAPNTTRSEFFDHLVEQHGTSPVNPFGMTTQSVAKITRAAMRRGKSQRILSLSGRLLIFGQRVFPRTFARVWSKLAHKQ